MLTILTAVCYSISALILVVFCLTLLIKLLRISRDRTDNRIKKDLENALYDFSAGIRDAAHLAASITTPRHEKIAALFLLEQLEIFSGEEAERISSFLDSLPYIQRIAANLASGNPWKRVHAATVIGNTRIKKYADHLTRLLNDPREMVIIAAAYGLAKIGVPESLPFLIETIGAIKPSQAHRIVDSIIELCGKNTTVAIPHISALLTSEKEYLRFWGCIILGELHSFDGLSIMQTMIKDASPRVRSAAVEALGKIGDPASYEHIALALLDPDWQVRGKAAWALGELRYQNAAPALARALMDRQWEVNNQALKSLLAVDTHCSTFISLLTSDFPFIRWRAAEALEITGYIDALIQSCGKELPAEEKLKKIEILKSCAANGARIPLQNHMNNSNERIQQCVQDILKTVEPHV